MDTGNKWADSILFDNRSVMARPVHLFLMHDRRVSIQGQSELPANSLPTYNH